MRLKKVLLENFRRFEKLEVEIHTGLTGIRGPNGSGKSSFLEGIFYGLTGTPLREASKKDLIKWGEKRGRVVVWLETANGDIKVERWLGREKVTLTAGDVEVAGARAVNDYLGELIPIPVDYLRDILFVAQEQLDAPLIGTEASRKDAFGKLFGCDEFDRLRDIIQEITSRYAAEARPPSREEVSNTEEEINKTTKEINKLEQSLKDAEEEKRQYSLNELNAIAHSPDSENTIKKIQELIDIEKDLQEITKSFSQEQIASWNRSAVLNSLQELNLKIQMDNKGACPTCGHEAEKLLPEDRLKIEKEIEELTAIKNDYEAFDSAMGSLLEIDKQRELLPDPKTLYTKEQKEEAKLKLQNYNALENCIKADEHRHGYLLGSLEHNLEKLKQLYIRDEEAKKVMGKLDRLSNIRAFLHRDVLQKQLRSYGASRINEHLNRFVSLFNIPYQVYFTEDGLMQFTDDVSGTAHDFGELSGGQKKLIALAYRLALMRLFVQGLNVAILDEPTAYVDSENIEAMRDAFSSLDVFAKEKGLAILIATHEPALLPVFPNIMEL